MPRSTKNRTIRPAGLEKYSTAADLMAAHVKAVRELWLADQEHGIAHWKETLSLLEMVRWRNLQKSCVQSSEKSGFLR
jgi:hypothetical protein